MNLEKDNDLARFLHFMELASYYKEEYYRTRPIMRFLNLIGVDRGVESRATQYALKRAKHDLEFCDKVNFII